MTLPTQRGRSANAPFEIGSIVRLTEKAIRAFTKTSPRSGPRVVNWNRVGKVTRCTNYEVHVLWPNRKSSELLPVEAIEYSRYETK